MENPIHFCRGAGIAMGHLIAASATVAVALAQHRRGTRNKRRDAYARRVPGKQILATLLIWMSLVSPSSWSQDEPSARKCKPKSEDSGQPQISQSTFGLGSAKVVSEKTNAGTRPTVPLVVPEPLIERQDERYSVKTTLRARPSGHEDKVEGNFLRVEELRENIHPGATEDVAASAVAVQTSVAGEYVLSLHEPHSEPEVAELLAPFGASVVRQIAQRPIYLIHVPGDDSQSARASAVDEIRRLRGVAAVDPEFLVEPMSQTIDPEIAKQWHLYNDGSTGGTVGADIGALKGWALSKCASRPLVAVIDTDIAIDGPDLKSNIWTNKKERDGKPGNDDDNNGYIDDEHGWDFVDDDKDVLPGTGSHGTKVAAIIAAVGGNEVGGSGICPHGQVMPIRAITSSPHSGIPKSGLSQVVAAIYYAIDNSAAIINASWGLTCWGNEVCPPETLRAAVAKAAERQILVVTGAGNSTTDIDGGGGAFYPASLEEPNVVAVAATNHHDKLWVGSNFGLKSVDLAAPGQDICATSGPRCSLHNAGTSYSAAMVSGAALLIRDRFSIESVEQLRSQILDNVQKFPALTDIIATGGRLDVYKALCVCPPWMPADKCPPPCSEIPAAACGARP